jgi:hypothetical protein
VESVIINITELPFMYSVKFGLFIFQGILVVLTSGTL